MGCDIHWNVEVRRDGSWVEMQLPEVQDYIDWFTYWNNVPGWYYKGRHYELFAILANVRNGYGFAGCDMGDPITPISMPKGLPDDVTETVKAESERWGVDGHSHTWLTLRELQEYDWDQESIRRGAVSLEEYETRQRTGQDYQDWCGGIHGPNIVTIPAILVESKAKRLLNEKKKVYVQDEWAVSLRETMNYFIEGTMKSLAELGEPDDVRIVIWFDN